MNDRLAPIALAVALVIAMVGAAVIYHAERAIGDSKAQHVGSTLIPIGALLRDDQALIKELQSEPFTEKDSGILESYLAKVRRDGVAKHADMKQRLDQLAETNTTMVALIKAYAPHAKTAVFTTEADKFRNYASAWRDRWNSMMELFMAGGNYPASEVPFPMGFPEAVQTEIAAAK
jgi:hypothetical protein